MNKICPIMSAGMKGGEEGLKDLIPCQENKCGFWVIGYTQELNEIQCCALEYIARKDSDSFYHV